MSHNVYKQCVAVAARNGAAWHGLGTQFGDDITVMEACQQADAFVRIALGYPAGGYKIVGTDEMVTPDMLSRPKGDVEKPPTHLTILRAPHGGDTEWEPIGQCTKKFTILQNEELARLVEPLTKFGRVETVGVLDQGAKFFITFEGGAWSANINGKDDEQRQYMIVKNTHRPGAAVQLQMAQVRVVCENTWFASDSAATFNVPIIHNANVAEVTSMMIGALVTVPDRIKMMKQHAEFMAKTRMEDAEVKGYFYKLLPIPKEPMNFTADASKIVAGGFEEVAAIIEKMGKTASRRDQDYMNRVKFAMNMRELCKTTYESSETVDRGTAWGAYNAFTEVINYGLRSASSITATPSTKASVTMGTRNAWLKAAYTLALDPSAEVVMDEADLVEA